MSRVIYFVERESDGLVKIGFTKRPKSRLKTLAREHGRLDLLGLVDGGRVREKVLHLLFDAARVEGEFFRLTDKLETFIEDHAHIPDWWTPPAPSIPVERSVDHSRVAIHLTVDSFLNRLEAEVKTNPRDKRDVPSIPDLAEAAGVSRGAMYNLVTGRVKHVNLELLSAAVNELQRRGFEVELSDLLAMYPVELVS